MQQEGPYLFLSFRNMKYYALKNCCRHNERTAEDGNYSHRNVDAERSHMNFHYIHPKGNYTEQFDLLLQKYPDAGLKKNSICGIEALFGMPDEIRETMSNRGVHRLFRHAMEFLTVENGLKPEHILSAVVHMDENDLHMHLVFVPIDEKGKLNGSAFFNKIPGLSLSMQMSGWQTRYYDYMHSFYPFIQRGKYSEETGRTQIPLHCAQRMRDDRLRNRLFLEKTATADIEEIKIEYGCLLERYGNLDKTLLSITPYLKSLERRLRVKEETEAELRKMKSAYTRLAKELCRTKEEKTKLEDRILKWKREYPVGVNRQHSIERNRDREREYM